jgi:uncharacterized protein YndB with AHSA1/START domain/class 3 adenylate cyclase
MLKQAERGCLVIADITGYTGLMVATELEHAQDAMGDLLKTVVGQLRPQLRLAKLEGDAAFMFTVTDDPDGPQLMDTLEGAYFAFRRRLNAISRATTCDCNACLRLPGLDLKVIAHYGAFVRERVFGTEELGGPDVIVAHRLLKNSVSDRLGLGGYLLLTDACVTAASLDPTALEMIETYEEAEGIGTVRSWVHDLGKAWAAEQERRRVRVSERQTAARVEIDLPIPPASAWQYLTAPQLRMRWQPGLVAFSQELADGRRGVGTVNHCVHGDGATLEEVLDWRPFEYFTMLSTIPGGHSFVSTDDFAETPQGTRVTVRFRRPTKVAERAAFEQMGPMLLEMYAMSIDRLKALVASDLAQGTSVENAAQSASA